MPSAHKEFTEKSAIHVKKLRMWDGAAVLEFLTVDERVVKRVAGRGILKEFPDGEVAGRG